MELRLIFADKLIIYRFSKFVRMANRKENPLDVEYMSGGIFNAKSNCCASLIRDIFNNGIIVCQLSNVS